ncbi:MAG: TolC family protein [Nitrospira sp.]|nr:TolC family protein [Nitrospira sp.]
MMRGKTGGTRIDEGSGAIREQIREHPPYCRIPVAGSILAALLAAGGSAWAQEQATLPLPIENPPVLKLSLAEAVGAALDKSPNIRLFRERIEAARAVSRTQLGAMLPHVTTTGKYNTQTFFLGTIGGAPIRTDPFEIVDGRAAFTQSIFSLSLIERWRASRSALQVAELDAAATENDTVAKVALGYFEVLRNQETLEARSTNVILYEELVAFIKSRQTGGMATGLDVARLETQLQNERQRLELAKGETERAKFALLNAIGIGYDVSLRLTDELKTFEGLIPSLEHAMESARANRPELKAQMQRIRTAELNVRSVKGERLPSMSAEGNYGLIGNKFDNNTGTYNVGVQLSIPIFDGGQREGRIGQGVSEFNQEQYKLALVKNQIGMELREALVTLKTSIEQQRIAEAGLKASLTELSLARERIRTLSSNTLELSNALSSIVRARDNMIDALFRVNASRVNLARAQGQVEMLK